jgi:hypothetical protein
MTGKPAIVTVKQQGRRKAWSMTARKPPPEIKAFLARLMRPPGA